MFCSLAFLALAQVMYATCTPKTFDYVIVGSGPAGLVIANRLSADPKVTVAVIEAGDSAYSNPNVTTLPKLITEYGAGLDTSVDWSYSSAPQTYMFNRTLPYHAGKALGGTTTINGMTFLRAEKAQIDAWEELGNQGWNWDSLWDSYSAQEGFQPPNEEQRRNGATYEDAAHGFNGDLSTGFTPYLVGQGFFNTLKETSEALGYLSNSDANDGSMRGTTTWPMTIDASKSIREDAARAFYYPVAESRPNLHVFLNTTATRIVFEENECSTSEVVATGVEVISSDNTTETIRGTREVIISAGSIRSPALLEHSGIGNQAVLEPLGIKTVVSHPTIGSNLQDQPNIAIVYTSPTNWTGYPTFVSLLTASDLFGDDLPGITEEIRANISVYAGAILADYAPHTTTLEIQEKLLKHQVDLIFDANSTVPLAEILWAPAGNLIIVPFWNLLPLSRGSIHVTSPDPLLPPSINPQLFQLPIDSFVQAAIAVRVREFFATGPLSEHVTSEISPGIEAVPQNASWRDPSWATWIKKTSGTNTHPVSTCAMMSKELGGVVDKEGKVYGTKNVRVVDASIFPTQISGHLSASVYALAGRIADSILAKTER
ncbi:GMC oxidoreductase [Cucurbitaria berberidis CBS 394.84]|uniref:GMC oxidoreductase n=1 Tax=Cucurbitaria berberidis CBS 394.84 TaxID=1168544 RepID=A0A9P4GML4_9PLEO|nr:GMC oxidoreductase [Cucurbitaria berberidis CBS 394.84]KAF1847977.1 GMC oxidoreductase [Cucurbitaria berberidis CBS 394.84]